MTTTAALDATASAVTAGFNPPPAQLDKPKGGWFMIGHNVDYVIDRLPKSKRATARAVYWAYRKLASRNGNAQTFNGAVHLVAQMAGVSDASVKRLDAFFKDAGLISIAAVKDDRGLDAPRRITLHTEFPIPQDVFVELTADEIRQALPTRRERPLAQRVVGAMSDTKEKEKERVKETLSHLPAPRNKRESVEECWRNLAEEHGMDAGEVRRLWEKHEANIGKLTSGAYATPENFRRAFKALRDKHHQHENRIKRYHGVGNAACYAEPQVKRAAAARAEAERTRWFNQFAASTANVPSAWHDASEAVRMQFMASNEGANFLALAESFSARGAYFELDEETGVVAAK
jgi:hypothetical protein